MTIEQAQVAAELLEHRKRIRAIQLRMKSDNALLVLLAGNTISVPEEALPYIKEAFAKAEEEIDAKIAEI